MEEFLRLLCLLILILISGCSESEKPFRAQKEDNLPHHDGLYHDAYNYEYSGKSGTVEVLNDTNILFQTAKKIGLPHALELDGVFEQIDYSNGKEYHKHQINDYYVFWNTGMGHGKIESNPHTGGHDQGKLFDKLGSDEIIYSNSDRLMRGWSSHAVVLAAIEEDKESHKDKTGVVKQGSGTTIILESAGDIDIPHAPELDGVYKQKGYFNGKRYYKHQNKNYYIFWDTGKDYGQSESGQHTGGHNQWDLSDELGGDEIIYSSSGQLLGYWSTDLIVEDEDDEPIHKFSTVKQGPDSTIILESTGKVSGSHGFDFDGIYEQKGWFNSKRYYKHQSKNFFIFWDTGKSYGQTESEQHTGGSNQWDLSDKLGGDEIIYSNPGQLLGDWSNFQESVE